MVMTPILEIFDQIGSIFYVSSLSKLIPSFCRKKSVCLYIIFSSRDT